MRQFPLSPLFLGFLALVAALILLSASPSFSQEVVTKGLFIERFFVDKSTRPTSAEPYVPAGIENLPVERRYAAVAEHLKSRGVNLLVGTKPDDPLTWEEYITLTYLLAGGEPGKTLAEQMALLKSKGVFHSNQIGFVKAFEGEATITRDKTKERIQVKGADPVLFKDIDETEFEAKLQLMLDDGSTLTIGEDTAVVIDEMVYDPKTKRRSVVIRLAAGIIKVKATKNTNPDSKFTVITPTMVAGVRGSSSYLGYKCPGVKISPWEDWERFTEECTRAGGYGGIYVTDGIFEIKRNGSTLPVGPGFSLVE